MFDFKAFLAERWPTPDSMRVYLNMNGQDTPTIHALVKWYARSKIPAEWFAVLCALREIETGKPISLTKFMK